MKKSISFPHNQIDYFLIDFEKKKKKGKKFIINLMLVYISSAVA